MNDMTMTTADMAHSDADMMAEHMGAMNLLLPADASHVAIKSGNWSDPSIWAGGRVPNTDADVHIPDGISVRYDVQSNASLHFVRVDGALNWATNVDTKMLVDTVIGTATSTVTIGTATDPLKSHVNAEIIFADNGKIDLRVDPEQLSRGFIAHGDIEVHGKTKAAYLAVSDAPSAGDKTITLEGDLSNWSVGDEIVIMGVEQNKNNAQGQIVSQDEERTITKIHADGTIELNKALQYDHLTPDGYDFDVYVGNQTRNVVFSSENPEGVRGHVMVMHSDGADIRYAAFDDLGRTDTSEFRGDDANPNGRYPLHLHRTGISEDADMSMLVGNAVSGGPGWGIVQHESHAAVDYNFVYDIAGAGIVSETGNETGQWIGNFVTSVYGDGEKFDHVRDEMEGQFGHAGVAYENQSRLIIQQDNIASGSQYAWVFRASEIFETDGSEELALDRDTVQFDPDPTGKVVLGEEAQIMAFIGNEAIAVDVAFDSGHRVGITQETDLQSQIFDFTVWNSSRVIDLMNYTSNYVIKDSTFVNGFQAVFLSSKQESTNLINVTIDGFAESIVNGGYNSDGVLVDVDIINSKTPFITRDGKPMEILDGSTLKMLDAPIVTIDGSSDLLMKKGNEDELFIKGTITDSAGTYGFAQNEWIDQPHSVSNGLTVRFNEPKFFTYDEAFDHHGTMQQADGSWVMPVLFWVSDRVTGEPHAVIVDIDVQGFDDAYLRGFEIDQVVIPDTTVSVLDVKYGETGTGNVDPEPAPEVTPPVTVPVEPSKPDVVEKPDLVDAQTPTEPTTPDLTPVTDDGVDGDDGGNAVAGNTLFELAGDYIFNGDAANIINLDHSDDLLAENVTISFSFTAYFTDKIRGLLSKDANGLGDGGHLSVSVKYGQLEIDLSNENESRSFTYDGIEANQDYDLSLSFGSDGVSIAVDDSIIASDPDFAMSWEDNTENLQVGALGKWSNAGADDYAALLKGEISDFSITGSNATKTDETPVVAPDPAPVVDEPIDAPEKPVGPNDGAVVYSLDQLTLDGKSESIINMAHDSRFAVDDAHISLTFNAAYTDKNRGIFSKDADGYGDGGHVSAAVRNGVLEVRLQNAEDEITFYADDVDANRDYDLDIGFSDAGIWVTLDDEMIGADNDFAMSWGNNEEHMQIGALGKSSDAGSDAAYAYFKGVISDVTITTDVADSFIF